MRIDFHFHVHRSQFSLETEISFECLIVISGWNSKKSGKTVLWGCYVNIIELMKWIETLPQRGKFSFCVCVKNIKEIKTQTTQHTNISLGLLRNNHRSLQDLDADRTAITTALILEWTAKQASERSRQEMPTAASRKYGHGDTQLLTDTASLRSLAVCAA